MASLVFLAFCCGSAMAVMFRNPEQTSQAAQFPCVTGNNPDPDFDCFSVEDFKGIHQSMKRIWVSNETGAMERQQIRTQLPLIKKARVYVPNEAAATYDKITLELQTFPQIPNVTNASKEDERTYAQRVAKLDPVVEIYQFIFSIFKGNPANDGKIHWKILPNDDETVELISDMMYIRSEKRNKGWWRMCTTHHNMVAFTNDNRTSGPTYGFDVKYGEWRLPGSNCHYEKHPWDGHSTETFAKTNVILRDSRPPEAQVVFKNGEGDHVEEQWAVLVWAMTAALDAAPRHYDIGQAWYVGFPFWPLLPVANDEHIKRDIHANTEDDNPPPDQHLKVTPFGIVATPDLHPDDSSNDSS